jgi:glycine betaine catabolism B
VSETAVRRVTVLDVISRSHNVRSIRVGPFEESSYTAGQFLSVRLDDDPQMKRWLSFSSSPTEKGYIEFTKKLTQSAFSQALAVLKPGDTIEIEYPFGKFTLDQSRKRIAFISGGVGITPIRSMCRYAADMKLDVDIRLVYANQSVNDILFKDDFDKMQDILPSLHVSHVLCEAAEGFVCTVGLINARIIRNEIPDYRDRLFYLCGPPGMVAAVRKMLEDELGVGKDSIAVEGFVGY